MPRTMRRPLRPLAFALGLACLGARAAAAPPPNDDFDSAIVVDALPFSDVQEASESTVAVDDPSYSYCSGYLTRTIWYSFTPAADVQVDASAGSLGAVHVYTGSRGSLSPLACGGFQSTVSFQALAGTTYHFLISVSATPPLPAWVTFTLQETPPPPPPPVNDEITSATVVPQLPFSETTNMGTATASPGDPACYSMWASASIWYSFTPSTTLRVQVDASTPSGYPTLVVATGSPGQLSTLACGSSGWSGTRVRWDAVAGQTYWVMAGTTFYASYGGAAVSVSFSEAPPPYTVGVALTGGSVVSPTGQATLTGTLTCNEPSFTRVSGILRQQHGGRALEAWFWSYVECQPGREIPWSATPTYGLGLFRGRSALLYTPGPAELQLYVEGSGWLTGEYDREELVGPLHLTGKN